MKKFAILLLLNIVLSISLNNKKINNTDFIYLNNRMPEAIDINNYKLITDVKTLQKHYYNHQYYQGIKVFGKNTRIHFNINNQPSSMSSNIHLGTFDISIPSISLNNIIIHSIIPDFRMPNTAYKNQSVLYYVEDNHAKLVYHIDAVTHSKAFRYLVNAHSGAIEKKWSLIYNDGPIIGSGENLLGEIVDTIHIYEGDSFSSMGNLITPYLLCGEFCWDYGDCDNQNYNDCELSPIQGNCPDNYLEDCNGDCFHSWYMQFPGVGNGFCNAPWIDVQESTIGYGTYNMVDESNPELGLIFTINSYGGFYEDLSYVNSESSSFISSIPENSHASGVSAHDYQRKVLDYFWNHHQYAGIDGNGKRVISIINYGSGGGISQNNAFYNAGLDALSYGIAGGAYRPFCAAQDIVGHEFTHGFTAHHSGLIYENQPGALNESMSDVFGYFVEAEYQDGGDWTEGEDIRINGGASRSFENPPTYGDPDNINHPYFVSYTDNPNMFTNDNGGVHSNSGIPNKVMYLVIKGDEHYGIIVNPFDVDIDISRDIASSIWYNWNRYYLGPEDDFAIAREKMLQVTHDLYPNHPTYYQTVANAWASVGVGEALMFGDVNSDDIINIQDIIILIGIVLDNIEPNEQQEFQGDLNQDSIIDILDIIMVINIILG